MLSDRQVLDLRGPKAALDPSRAYAAAWEEERDDRGTLAPTAVVFLTNKECPFHCVMCDLWHDTLDAPVPVGSIPLQIRAALAALPPARQIKLYNAGSFFDPQAIPPDDDGEIAGVVAECDRVIVEAHPAFLRGAYGERCLRLRDRVNGRLEVAIGLETAEPGVLARLNKRMTLDDFAAAAAFLRRHDIDLRAFILLQPPFMPAADAVEWGCRSIDYAFDHGAHVCSIIPTRHGNGAMEALGAAAPKPSLDALEAVVEYGVSLGRGRVFADLWEVERFFSCDCSPCRATRLRDINRDQQVPAAISCACLDRR